MKQFNLKAFNLTAVLIAAVFSINVVLANAQEYGKSKENTATKQTSITGGLTAKLIDPEKKANAKAAAVEVTVTGVVLKDPGKVGEIPKKGQAHLHYQVDDGPVIATTATKLSFHGLTPGQHKITVALAANDHTPLGPQETLTVTIP